MKRLLPFVAVVSVLSSFASFFALAEDNHAAPATIRRLDGSTISGSDAESFAKKTLEAAHVTGAQIAVLNSGHLVWSAAFGQRRTAETGASLLMDTDTTLWAASITKSVFSTYVMQLVERGEFNLDLPISQQLPQPLDTYEPYKFKASAIVHDPLWLTVTPRMLLSHTSGLANFADLEADKKMRLRFKPGSQFLYSGEGINLVQFVLEQRAQKPLDQILQEAFFTPLGMARTGLIYRTEFADDVADRYDLNEKFRSKTQRFPARAAGSMTTSAEDLARFVSALFAGKILKPATMQQMFHPYFVIHDEHEFPLKANEPESAEAPGVGLGYGVGWGLLTHTKFGPAFFKEGHGDGAQNYILCFERSQSCMIILTNSDNGELAFRPLLETILGDTVTPWEWEGYTPSYIEASRKNQ
ncbi:serine hydrolase domain-containing protein [Acidicapsa ligni]|uniref:serine hydrolase domain-containing protein n=1 Tax=Acidicapsa ligni TaxID=542300 RepID=UPI0021DF7BDA|nr:serine hydrolase domain-containing protein [Acidicapsa ligni]